MTVGQELARAGNDREAVARKLHEMFPESTPDTCQNTAICAVMSVRGRREEPVAEEPPPQPPPPQYSAPLGPAVPPKPELPTRLKYNWNPTGIALPHELRETKTRIAATIASMPGIFNGAPNATHQFSWGTVRLQGVLTPFDLQVYVALSQEIQQNGCQAASGALAAETSFAKLYRLITSGKYGGSGCARLKRSLDRMKQTIVVVRQKDGSNYSFRLLESYEAVKARSGKRLLVRIGQTLTDRTCIPGSQGCKPVELEPWRQLKGRAAIGYLIADYLCALHGKDGHVARISVANMDVRLNLKGSEVRRKRAIDQLVEKLDGLACSAGGFLRAQVIAGSIEFSQQLEPVAKTS